MTTARDVDFEDAMVQRLTRVAQHAVDVVALMHAAGTVDDLEQALGAELAEHGINDLSATWFAKVADSIRSGDPVALTVPVAD